MAIPSRPWAMPVLSTSLLCTLVLTLGCDESPTAPTPLTEVTWELTTIEQGLGPSTPIPDPSRFTLRLNSDGTASVRSDCNTCGGRFTQSGSGISMPALACTRAFCGTNLDAMYTTALSQAQTFATTQGELVLRGPSVTLRFRRQAS